MPQIIFASKDLLFPSQVTSAARPLSLECQIVGSLAAIAEACSAPTVRLFILDLSSGLSPAEAMQAARAIHKVTTLAFAPHVQHALLDAAKQAGFEHVMPRSCFSTNLVDWLRMAL